MMTALEPVGPLEPVDALRLEAHERRQRIIELGDEIQDREFEQAQHLLWFRADSLHWRCLQYDSWEEFICQEDMMEALGLTAHSKGARSKGVGLFMIHAVIPEARVFGKDHSKVQEALGELRPLAERALAAPEEGRRDLARELLQKVDDYRSMKLEEVQRTVQIRRPPRYHLTSNGNKPAVAKVDGEGELEILLVQADDCDPVGAGRVMAKITKSFNYLEWDEEGIWGRKDGAIKLAMRWANGDIPYERREAAAQACGAERRI